MVRMFGFAVAMVTVGAVAGAPADADPVRVAARLFGQAFVRAEPALLAPLLPKEGKVRMHLGCLGPESGVFSPAQVQALLRDFLLSGAVRSFDVLRIDDADPRFAWILGRATVKDREGRLHQVGFHLTLRPENGHWVLEEIRETGR